MAKILTLEEIEQQQQQHQQAEQHQQQHQAFPRPHSATVVTNRRVSIAADSVIMASDDEEESSNSASNNTASFKSKHRAWEEENDDHGGQRHHHQQQHQQQYQNYDDDEEDISSSGFVGYDSRKYRQQFMDASYNNNNDSAFSGGGGGGGEETDELYTEIELIELAKNPTEFAEECRKLEEARKRAESENNIKDAAFLHESLKFLKINVEEMRARVYEEELSAQLAEVERKREEEKLALLSLWDRKKKELEGVEAHARENLKNQAKIVMDELIARSQRSLATLRPSKDLRDMDKKIQALLWMRSYAEAEEMQRKYDELWLKEREDAEKQEKQKLKSKEAELRKKMKEEEEKLEEDFRLWWSQHNAQMQTAVSQLEGLYSVLAQKKSSKVRLEYSRNRQDGATRSPLRRREQSEERKENISEEGQKESEDGDSSKKKPMWVKYSKPEYAEVDTIMTTERKVQTGQTATPGKKPTQFVPPKTLRNVTSPIQTYISSSSPQQAWKARFPISRQLRLPTTIDLDSSPKLPPRSSSPQRHPSLDSKGQAGPSASANRPLPLSSTRAGSRALSSKNSRASPPKFRPSSARSASSTSSSVVSDGKKEKKNWASKAEEAVMWAEKQRQKKEMALLLKEKRRATAAPFSAHYEEMPPASALDSRRGSARGNPPPVTNVPSFEERYSRPKSAPRSAVQRRDISPERVVAPRDIVSAITSDSSFNVSRLDMLLEGISDPKQSIDSVFSKVFPNTNIPPAVPPPNRIFPTVQHPTTTTTTGGGAAAAQNTTTTTAASLTPSRGVSSTPSFVPPLALQSITSSSVASPPPSSTKKQQQQTRFGVTTADSLAEDVSPTTAAAVANLTGNASGAPSSSSLEEAFRAILWAEKVLQSKPLVTSPAVPPPPASSFSTTPAVTETRLVSATPPRTSDSKPTASHRRNSPSTDTTLARELSSLPVDVVTKLMAKWEAEGAFLDESDGVRERMMAEIALARQNAHSTLKMRV